jgi:tetratricopeptide (TPR) repeat protein
MTNPLLLRRGVAATRITAFVAFAALLAPPTLPVAAQVPKSFEPAAAAFDAGHFAEAEHLLRDALAREPENIYGLNLLAVTLDREGQFKEAESVYRRALSHGANAALVNNLANHYRSMGENERARKYYLETLRLDPHHANANYQLAALDLAAHRPADALRRTAALDPAEQKRPAVILLRAQALLQGNQTEAAKRALAPLEAAMATDSATAFSLGVMYFEERLYADAARAFEAMLAQSPGNFDALYNLGLADYRLGEKSRSAEVLGRAARLNPRSADALYHLAVIEGELGRHEEATEHLIRAREAAPTRADVSLALAHECVQQEFWYDAADAYGDYLRLKPDDFATRKELATLDEQLKNYDQALAEMNRYVAGRPRDAEGFNLRGLVSWRLKRFDDAARDFHRALDLNPHLATAWSRLGEIARQRNDLDEAARSYGKAIEIQADDSEALYGLGLVLNLRGRHREAAARLVKAVEAKPDEPAPHYQLSIAYRHLGKEDEARAELDKFQGLRGKMADRKYLRTGLLAYLSAAAKLTEAERQAREISYLERATALKPDDAALRARLIAAYFAAGKKGQAEAAIRQWLDADTTGQSALRIGEIFAARNDDERAAEQFRRALEQPSLKFAASLELAEAESRLGKNEEALALVEPLEPPADAAVDYQLLRASILDRLERYNEALDAYEKAIQLDPRQENSYLELGVFFVRHVAYNAAVEDFRAAERILPQALRLALAEAIVLNLAGHREESYQKLQSIEARWPEQDLPYILAGISAFTAYRADDARREFEKAAALDSTNPLTFYYLALLDTQSGQSEGSEAVRWAELAVKGDPSFAQARLLLGKLYRTLGKNSEARENLEAAVRIEPNLAEAHYLLGRIYAEQGDAARADAETQESIRWHREVHQVSPDKENIQRLLVDIGPSRR